LNLNPSKVLKAFLHRSTHEADLRKFLSEGENAFLSELPSPNQNASLEVPDIHYSWWIPLLKELPEKDASIYLSALPHKVCSRIEEHLSIQKKDLPRLAKQFLREKLHLMIQERPILLPAFLPSSPFNDLLEYTKNDLLELIDSLSLFDVVFELRQILETKKLKKIYSLLTEEQKNLMGQITPSVSTYAPDRLGLDGFKGSLKEFKTLLHRRGLIKFCKAMQGQDPDLIWWLAHKLDTGRGAVVLKPHDFSLLEQNQLLELMELL
jgi:hypothetical protein